MRPAQLTPENEGRDGKGVGRKHRFNEAGAINAGKQADAEDSRALQGGFNEAGAINAGKLFLLEG